MAGALQYEEHLRRLWEAAGEPSAQSLSDRVGVAEQRLDDWLAGRVVPRRGRRVRVFLETLESLARQRSRVPLPSPRPDAWDRLRDEARRRRQGRRPVRSSAVCDSGVQRDWLSAAEGSKAWTLVAPAAADQVEPLRALTLEAVSRLAELHEAERDLLLQDPWYDPALARRTARWTNLRLADIKSRLGKQTLAPAEAALLVLLPFLYDVHSAWTLTVLRHVDPTNLDDRTQGGAGRQSYNRVLRDHKRLIRQALRAQTLPDRSDGRPEIGWWLFHQWVKTQAGRLDDVLDAMGVVVDDMGAVLDPALLGRLLSCAHLGPRKLFGGKPDGPWETPFPVDFDGCDAQTVRECLVGPLFAIAHAMAIEVTDLPSTVVKHVGIPDPVDPGQLLRRLDDAQWSPLGDALALDAECDHPAAVAALTEHAQYVDALLREARRTRPTEEIGSLPVYAHADGVREVDEWGEPRQAGEVIRFRLDEERIQELLMGENLYRDRSLAIRELYQNALDACRYLRASRFARDRQDTYQGKITFRQGYDPVEQRYFLECEDNGIGMDETVLAEVFSRAGVRFSDHSRFREMPWQARDGAVTVHPNSRFGIGVLSYFMLADEIRVTTCPEHTGTGRPEQLTVLITGPGHYFRVSRTGQWGPVGTTVRLYLRDEDMAPSCVRELRRLLGIAEFRTTAIHGTTQEATWAPGALQPREVVGGPANGFVAHGRTVSWPEDGRRVDGQVVWCEHGGGILADGIFIEPRVRRGVLAGPEEGGRLRGVVVNLTGKTRPKDLSVDRAEILDPDVDRVVEELIRAALPALFAADPPLLTGEWLAEVAQDSPRLADIVTEAAGEAGVSLDVNGHAARVRTVGFFADDVFHVHLAGPAAQRAESLRFRRMVPDETSLLWRLLAHRPNAELEALTAVVPELSRVRAVLPALPSDVWMRTRTTGRGIRRQWIRRAQDDQPVHPGDVVSAAMVCGMSYDEVLDRMERLGLPTPDRPRAEVPVDATTVMLLDRSLRGVGEYFSADRWLPVADPVPPGHLVKAHLVLNIGIDEALDRLRKLGFRVPDENMRTETPAEWVIRLLSSGLDGSDPWLDRSGPVLAGHLVRAVRVLDRSLDEVVGRLADYGLRPDLGALSEGSAGELLRLSDAWGWPDHALRQLDVRSPVPPALLAQAAVRSGAALSDIAHRLGTLGLTTGSLPERVADADLALLDVSDPSGTSREVSLMRLVERAEASGLPPREAAERMRAYGLLPRYVTLPERMEPEDEQVITGIFGLLPLGADDLTVDTVPMLTILRAADDFRLSPQAVIDCLHRYGVRTSHAMAPVKPSRHDKDLVDFTVEGSTGWGGAVPLFHLVKVPHRLLMEREEVTRRLIEFGFEVPVRELEGLDETDLSLCREGFGPNREELPLALRNPVEDFLQITRDSGLPLTELLPRLTRLGVDLPRVAQTIRTALPHVPGLVMEPEDDSPGAAPTTPTGRPSPAR
ncbi:wHTH domain-containing protein [Streptomyces sp. NPDC001709]